MSRVAPRVRCAGLLAVALLLLAPAASSATTAAASNNKSAQPPITLAGTTTLTGDRSGSTLVRVPSTARLVNPFGHFAGRQSLKGDGAGPAGFALVSTSRNGPVYVGALAPGRTGLNYIVMQIRGPDREPDATVIPPGAYRLYLITQHRGTKLSLTLGGLPGSATVVPHDPTQGVFETPPPDLDAPANKTAYTTGATTDVAGWQSIQLMIGLARHQIHTETVHLMCGWEGQHTTPGPHCPSPRTRILAPSVVSFETIDGLTHGLLWAGLYDGFAPGDRTTGYSMMTATPAESVGYLNMWLSLEEPEDE